MAMIREMYERMARFYASRPEQEWWPEDPLEVIVGAVLVQGTKWANVSRVLQSLKNESLLNFRALCEIEESVLEEKIRSVGFQQRKSPALKALFAFLETQFQSNLETFFSQAPEKVQSQLLAIKGIGRQTAENILLYAGNLEVYAVDKYTNRIFVRHGLIGTRSKEREIQRLIGNELPSDSRVFNEFQELIVRVARDFCGKTDHKCSQCPLEPLLAEGGPKESFFESVAVKHLEPLSPPPPPPKAPEPKPIEELELSETERRVISLIQVEGTPIDTVIAESGLPTGQVLATLSALEMRKLVRRKEGNAVART